MCTLKNVNHISMIAFALNTWLVFLKVQMLVILWHTRMNYKMMHNRPLLDFIITCCYPGLIKYSALHVNPESLPGMLSSLFLNFLTHSIELQLVHGICRKKNVQQLWIRANLQTTIPKVKSENFNMYLLFLAGMYYIALIIFLY